jgi:hypothetical protein
MANTNIDPDTTKLAMGLATALLVFASTAWNIVNSKLNKARNAAARDRIIGTTLGWLSTGLYLLACVIGFLGALDFSLLFIIAGFIVVVCDYFRRRYPPGRGEIFMLVLGAFFVLYSILISLLFRVVDTLTAHDMIFFVRRHYTL